ncbi:hypothetical protein [Prescottella subtropica]|uniref:hypothetical protein n=1 Tax=Prescottella subtropica TaxID=2545757 RepID=UPI0014789514|nr:hypothetical protein [Prescottella subtropica]
MSYVYREARSPGFFQSGVYEVGYYHPNGEWEDESSHSSSEDAAERARFLNGGN